jgi:hypothetical protein
MKAAALPKTQILSAKIGENNNGLIVCLSFFDGHSFAVNG